ncbi:MAG: hypothetical protein HY445_02475 [Candidatus Niyogibacteria bacterium]|nr:hypothetical protein [Candidatus Niyogibacteria bacterium]
MKKKRYVVAETFSQEKYDGELTIRISGGGIAKKREYELYKKLTANVDTFHNVTITRWLVGITLAIDLYWDQDDTVQIENPCWDKILPKVEKAFRRFFCDYQACFRHQIVNNSPDPNSIIKNRREQDLKEYQSVQYIIGV